MPPSPTSTTSACSELAVAFQRFAQLEPRRANGAVGLLLRSVGIDEVDVESITARRVEIVDDAIERVRARAGGDEPVHVVALVRDRRAVARLERLVDRRPQD